MVKITVDIGDNYWLAQSLTAIEKLATEEDSSIDDVSALVNSAQDAADKCNPNIPPMDDENIHNNILEDIENLQATAEKIKDKYNNK